MDKKKFYLTALRNFVKSKNAVKVRNTVDEIHSFDVANGIENWELEEIKSLFSLIGAKQASQIINHLSDKMQEKTLSVLSDRTIKEIVENLDLDEIVDMLSDIKETVKEKVLLLSKPKLREQILQQINLDKDSVGYHMHHEYIYLNQKLSTHDALKTIKTKLKLKGKELAGEIYVVDDNDIFIGSILLEDLLVAKRTAKIKDLVKNVESVKPTDKILIATNYIKKYDVSSLPVVNEKSVLIGVLEAGDIIDHIQEDNDFASKFTSKSINKRSDKKYSYLTSRQIIEIIESNKKLLRKFKKVFAKFNK